MVADASRGPTTVLYNSMSDIKMSPSCILFLGHFHPVSPSSHVSPTCLDTARYWATVCAANTNTLSGGISIMDGGGVGAKGCGQSVVTLLKHASSRAYQHHLYTMQSQL